MKGKGEAEDKPDAERTGPGERRRKDLKKQRMKGQEETDVERTIEAHEERTIGSPR
jgi:hypothetical protein